MVKSVELHSAKMMQYLLSEWTCYNEKHLVKLIQNDKRARLVQRWYKDDAVFIEEVRSFDARTRRVFKSKL